VGSADTPAERAFVAMRLDQLAGQFDQARAEMQADLDTYRDDWSSRHAEQLRAHNERMRELEAAHAAWLTNWLDGDPDEGRPTQDVGRGQVEASAAGSSPASTPGPGPGQLDPHAAELELARTLRDTPMSAWGEERQRYLDRANQGLFG
jgi:hypothetical protein